MSLFGLPALAYLAVADRFAGPRAAVVLVVSVLLSWATGQGLAYLGYVRLGWADRSAAARCSAASPWRSRARGRRRGRHRVGARRTVRRHPDRRRSGRLRPGRHRGTGARAGAVAAGRARPRRRRRNRRAGRRAGRRSLRSARGGRRGSAWPPSAGVAGCTALRGVRPQLPSRDELVGALPNVAFGVRGRRAADLHPGGPGAGLGPRPAGGRRDGPGAAAVGQHGRRRAGCSSATARPPTARWLEPGRCARSAAGPPRPCSARRPDTWPSWSSCSLAAVSLAAAVHRRLPPRLGRLAAVACPRAGAVPGAAADVLRHPRGRPCWPAPAALAVSLPPAACPLAPTREHPGRHRGRPADRPVRLRPARPLRRPPPPLTPGPRLRTMIPKENTMDDGRRHRRRRLHRLAPRRGRWSPRGHRVRAMAQYNSLRLLGLAGRRSPPTCWPTSRSSPATSATPARSATWSTGAGTRLPPGRADRDPVLLPGARTRYVDTNVIGTLNVLEAVRAAGHATGSCTPPPARPTAPRGPCRSARTTRYRPSRRTRPRRPAPTSWRTATTPASTLPAVTLRPFNTFGPRQSARAVIPTVISQVAAGAERDPARRARPDPRLHLRRTTPPQAFATVGTAPAEQVVGEVVQRRHRRGDLDRRPGRDDLRADGPPGAGPRRRTSGCARPSSEVMRLVCDSSKLRAATGWTPAHDLGSTG